MEILAVRWGPLFSPRYVRMLGAMVEKHHGSSLVTLTNMDDTPGRTAPLRTDLSGWWSKFELFAPWNRHLRPCLFFDLDTYILDDIRDLKPDGGFWMLRDFNRDSGASGVMMLPEDTDEIWNALQGKALEGGDQEYLNRFPHRKLQDRFDGIVSYKNDVLSYGRMGRIVCFHGKPKPHETDGWARSVWDESVGEGNPARPQVFEGAEETQPG